MSESNCKSVLVAGTGIQCALGNSAASCLKKLKLGIVPQTEVTIEWFDETATLPWYAITSEHHLSDQKRFYSILESVVSDALQDANLDESALASLGLFIGSSSFEIGPAELAYKKELNQFGLTDAMPMHLVSFGNLGLFLRQTFNLQGPDYVYGTACSAGANALLGAQRMLEQGLIDHALVVGIDLYNVTTLTGFHSMQLVSSDCIRPFDQSRSGLVLGEACAAVVLSGVAETQSPGDHGLRLLGGASFCDTSSVTSTSADGEAIRSVIAHALDDAQVSIQEIDAIKLHGTGSGANDKAEAAGLNQVFNKLPPAFSLKPFVGHTLGSCGVTELVLMASALGCQFVPATPGFQMPDPELQLSPTTSDIKIKRPARILLNHFGFGGNNTVLVAGYG